MQILLVLWLLLTAEVVIAEAFASAPAESASTARTKAESVIVENEKALDVDSLWDFQDPELSERRFVDALEHAQGESALILQTQRARTFSLRQDIESARAILRGIENELAPDYAQAKVRFNLEMGRTYASGAHPPGAMTAADKKQARSHYLDAHALAQASSLDGLAVDALHMMSFVETEVVHQLRWTEKALAYVADSDQLAAKKWEASLLNNAGYALHQLGRYADALAKFDKALVLREAGADAWATHVARWMVAWTLRSLDRLNEALALQLLMEQERDAAGSPDASVYEELETLYAALGNTERAQHYGERRRVLTE